MAVYAATLPTLRRRELYAGFLRSVEGDGDRREALEQAEQHMGRDVPAILKKVHVCFRPKLGHRWREGVEGARPRQQRKNGGIFVLFFWVSFAPTRVT